MKIFVLGGTGAMGVDLVKILGERGENVTVTSRSERKPEFNNVKCVKGDAHDTAFLQSLLNEQYDAIVDFMVYNTVSATKHGVVYPSDFFAILRKNNQKEDDHTWITANNRTIPSASLR